MEMKRIAVLGICLESNRFAPEVRRRDFEDYMMLRGAQLHAMIEQLGIGEVLNDAFDYELLPILVAAAESGGPLGHADYLDIVDEIETSLAGAGNIDGVLIFGHGAGLTTRLDDLDGDYFARVRKVVGHEVPIVAELDLHANLSDAMVEAVDIVVGYRTNPHVDQAERARECAEHLIKLLDGRQPTVAFQRLPLVSAQIAQLTDPGTPYGELIAYAEHLMENASVANITLLSGFSFGDTDYNGFAVCVTTWEDEAQARIICDRIAEQTWELRHRFIAQPMSLAQAVVLEQEKRREADPGVRIYAEIADNPGGGGRGNTIHLLKAFHEAGISGVLAGVYYDPALVKHCEQLRSGQTFLAEFNRTEVNPFSGHWQIEAKLEKTFEGTFKSRLGVSKDQSVRLGRCALVSIGHGKNFVVLCSLRNQLLSPEYFEIAGLDPREYQSLIVKSRGHFRAGFAHLVDDNAIFEVDGPGLTTANLSTVPWKNLPRPVFPIDLDTQWQPNAKVKNMSQKR